MVPLLCGLASRDKSESQKIVYKVVKSLGAEDAEYKNTEEYLRYLQGLFLGNLHKKFYTNNINIMHNNLESPITFLHCIHESRMKKIHILPPPSEKSIYIVQTKMAIHDIVSLAYYLENFDRLHTVHMFVNTLISTFL